MRPYIRYIRFSVEPHPSAPPFLASLCYNSSMDANSHNQPIRHDYPDPPHQGVIIEDYRGPLLEQLQRSSGVSASPTSSYSAPLFSEGPLPEWLAEQPHLRQPTRLHRWLTRMFRSDDAVLNSAKRGLGWMLVSLLGFIAFGATFVYHPQQDFVKIPLVVSACMSPFAILIFLPSALADSMGSWRAARRSYQPGLVRKLSVISLSAELIMFTIAIYVVILAVVQMAEFSNCFTCLRWALMLFMRAYAMRPYPNVVAYDWH